jgi:V/A-type H+-transporting ATPase subunit D
VSIESVAATKGTLQKAREQLKFIEKGKDVLKMKRDQLAGELNGLLGELGRRKTVEKLFAEAFDSIKYAFAVLGFESFSSAANAVKLMDVRGLPRSAVGVIMPEVKIVEKPTAAQVPSGTMSKATAKLCTAVEEAIELGVLEAKVEQLARELMDTNRKVNALEKVVIPRYQATIRYIEDRLNEQALQEFFVTRRIRDANRVTVERTQT